MSDINGRATTTAANQHLTATQLQRGVVHHVLHQAQCHPQQQDYHAWLCHGSGSYEAK